MLATKRTGFASALMLGAAMWTSSAHAQELEPRAFSAAPVGTSFVIAGAGSTAGAFVLDPSVPITDVQADIHFVTVGGGYTFELFGQQARLMAIAPYAWGDIAGDVGGVHQTQDLRGFVDPRIKFSIGLMGAPALSVEEFAARKRETVVGASFTVMPPWGQYDSESLVNLGYNRWALKPELGVSHPIGPWTLEGSVGAWFFTENDDYQGGVRRQDPIVAVQGHVGYTFKNGAWVAADATWFRGGQTEVDGVANSDRQNNARLGVTYSMPIAPRNSLKFSYSTGATTRRGSDFDTFNITWQRVMF